MARATFAMGCFWKPEMIFRNVPGVVDATVGYTGGHVRNPSYRQVCSGETGHAEAVQVEYDPERIGYEDLLEVFWRNHDPTQRNRQGPDIGHQYRSAIFWHDEDQRACAQASLAAQQRSGRFERPIATEIEPLETFWPAEAYHQRYLEKQGVGG